MACLAMENHLKQLVIHWIPGDGAHRIGSWLLSSNWEKHTPRFSKESTEHSRFRPSLKSRLTNENNRNR
jgi:hypothetical protein